MGAGTCTVTADQAGNSSYAPATPVSQSFAVTPAPLTVTANDVSKVYGAGNPAFETSITGFVCGETLATSGVTGAADCTTTATSGSAVGTYPITCTAGSLAAQNYSFTFASGSLSVTPRAADGDRGEPEQDTGDGQSDVHREPHRLRARPDTGDVRRHRCSELHDAPRPPAARRGRYPITCTVGTLTAANYSFGPFVAGTLTVVAPAFVFTTPPQTLLTTGVTSGAITDPAPGRRRRCPHVGLGNREPRGHPGAMVCFRNIERQSTITSVTIANGSSGASFRYRPSAAGSPTIRVSAGGYTSGHRSRWYRTRSW